MKIVAYLVRLHVVFNPTCCPLHKQSFFLSVLCILWFLILTCSPLHKQSLEGEQ